MKQQPFRFTERLRVRWAEVDLQRIVFNGHYLTYFDTAIAGYWRALALPYEATMEALEGDLYLRKATVEYEASARFDEQLDVGIRCASFGKSSFVLEGAVFRGGRRLATGELIYVFADPRAQVAKRVPAALREWLEAYERGAAMVDVRIGDWDQLGAEARTIRSRVFVEEQRIPAELEWDAADATCVHALACNRLGHPIGTGRLIDEPDRVARIGRMAVLPTLRGSGVGAALLDALMDTARERGAREVMLHAQASAVAFYRRLGFVARGAPFDEVGIEHQEMVHPLA